MKLLVLGLMVGASALCQFSVAGAEQIKYVFDGTGSGTLGAQTFSNVDLSATAVTDTADVPTAAGGGIDFNSVLFTINIGGVGSTNLSTGELDKNESTQNLDFGWRTSLSSTSVIRLSDPTLVNYDLKTAIGPITETGIDPFAGNWLGMSTSAGDLSVSSWDNVTFTATLGAGGAVPSPSAAWLSLIGLPFVAIAARRGGKAPRKV